MEVKIKLTIPEDVTFGDLHLSRNPETGDMMLDWAPIERICAASGVDIALFKNSPEGNLAGFLVRWYEEHLARGGERDVAADLIIAEAMEDERRERAAEFARMGGSAKSEAKARSAAANGRKGGRPRKPKEETKE